MAQIIDISYRMAEVAALEASDELITVTDYAEAIAGGNAPLDCGRNLVRMLVEPELLLATPIRELPGLAKLDELQELTVHLAEPLSDATQRQIEHKKRDSQIRALRGIAVASVLGNRLPEHEIPSVLQIVAGAVNEVRGHDQHGKVRAELALDIGVAFTELPHLRGDDSAMESLHLSLADAAHRRDVAQQYLAADWPNGS
jgi:hypothetical protein